MEIPPEGRHHEPEREGLRLLQSHRGRRVVKATQGHEEEEEEAAAEDRGRDAGAGTGRLVSCWETLEYPSITCHWLCFRKLLQSL